MEPRVIDTVMGEFQVQCKTLLSSLSLECCDDLELLIIHREHFLDHGTGPCKYEFSDHSGVFYSQNFPGPYPNRMSCRYKIHAKPGHCTVELNFVQFRLDENGAIHPAETCDHDYMELNGIKYCHRQLEGQISEFGC